MSATATSETMNGTTGERGSCGAGFRGGQAPWSRAARNVYRTGERMRGRGERRPADWSGINIAAMVVGFVFFWPVGLVVLFWILGGRDVRDLPGAVRRGWRAMSGRDDGRRGGRVGNVVFDDYQQTQHDRIRELEEELRQRERRFAEFREEMKRRADQEEFDRFMASAPERPEGRTDS